MNPDASSSSQKPPRIPVPTGLSMTAQGNALGFPVPWISALKGRSVMATRAWAAPSGLDSFWLLSLGVALGCHRAGRWPFIQYREKGVTV